MTSYHSRLIPLSFCLSNAVHHVRSNGKLTLSMIYILPQKAFIVNIICRFTHNKLLDHIEFTTVLLIDTTDAGGDQVNFTGVRQVSIP